MMTETTLLLFLSNMYLKANPIFSNIHLFHKHSSLPIGTPPPKYSNPFKAGAFSIHYTELLICVLSCLHLQLCPQEVMWHACFLLTLSQRVISTQHLECVKLLTDPSDALAPTLSPLAFQQTSKMPPVPR